jgi:hypothetical protein
MCAEIMAPLIRRRSRKGCRCTTIGPGLGELDARCVMRSKACNVDKPAGFLARIYGRCEDESGRGDVATVTGVGTGFVCRIRVE